MSDTEPQKVDSEDACKASESLVLHWPPRRLGGEKTKASSYEKKQSPVVEGREGKIEVQGQISLILASVALGGNGWIQVDS